MALDITRNFSERTETTKTAAGGVMEGAYRSARKQNIRPFPERPAFSNRLLAALPRTLIGKISTYFRPVYLRRGDYLFEPDDMVEYLYFPDTAVLSDYQMLDDGRTIEIALTGKESAVGIATVFGPSRAANWTQVCADGRATKIEADIFRQAAERENGVKEVFNEHLNAYIRAISHKVICNTHHSVEERLCTWLLMLADRCGDTTLKLTQEQIARVLGVYRPSVTCIATRLKDQGAISYLRGKVIIRNRPELGRKACACYREFCGAVKGTGVVSKRPANMG